MNIRRGFVFLVLVFLTLTTTLIALQPLRNRQQVLMDRVRNIDTAQPVEKYLKYLQHIYRFHEHSTDTKSERITQSFFQAIVHSHRHRDLHTHAYYYLYRLRGPNGGSAFLKKALAAATNPSARCFALLQLYTHYKDAGKSEPARFYLLKLIDTRKEINDRRGLESAYRQLALLYNAKKNYPVDLNRYFQALSVSPRDASSQYGLIYLETATIFRILNRNQLAAKYLEEAMNAANTHKDPPLTVKTHNAFSSLYYEEGDLENALKHIRFSLNIEKKSKTYVCAIDSLYRKALILSQLPPAQQRGTKIMELLKEAVEKGLNLEKYEGLPPILCLLGEKLIEAGELAEAALYMDRIDDIYAPYHPEFFYYNYLEARLFEKMNRPQEALNAYQKTAEGLSTYMEQLQDRPFHAADRQLNSIYSHIIEFYLFMFNRSGENRYLHRALFYSEIKNPYVYQATVGNNKQYRHLVAAKEKLETEYKTLLNQPPNGSTVPTTTNNDNNAVGQRSAGMTHENETNTNGEDNGNHLETLKRQQDELNEFLLEVPIGFKNYRFGDLAIPRLRRSLSPRQLVLKYVLLEEKAYVFYIHRDGIGYSPLDMGSRELSQLVERLTEPLDDFTRGNVDYLHINYDLQLAHQLYELLLKGVLESRASVNEIYVIPDRQLFKIPFEALVAGFKDDADAFDPHVVFSEYRGARYVIRDYAVGYYLSLFHIKDWRKNQTPPRFFLSAFGNPTLEPIRGRGNPVPDAAPVFNPIPSAETEIIDIVRIIGETKSKRFTGADFNRDNFERHAPLSRVVHIATHFVNNVDSPRYSALVFSAPRREPDSTEGKTDTGGGEPYRYYHAHQVYRLKLNASLVVLSACESSEKNLMGIQGLRGMTASFRHAGARAMVVSMWPVDKYASRLMPAFYKRYAEGTQTAAALRSAKLELMDQTVAFKDDLKLSYSHPFLWANYILFRFEYSR